MRLAITSPTASPILRPVSPSALDTSVSIRNFLRLTCYLTNQRLYLIDTDSMSVDLSELTMINHEIEITTASVPAAFVPRI